MAEKIQVVRVDDVERLYSTETVDGILYAIDGDLEAPYRLDDVIELTEQERPAGAIAADLFGTDLDDTKWGRRFVSEWGPVDG